MSTNVLIIQAIPTLVMLSQVNISTLVYVSMVSRMSFVSLIESTRFGAFTLSTSLALVHTSLIKHDVLILL